MWTSNINMNQCCYILSLPYACSIAQSCPTLCDPMDCSPPGSSIHGILQVGIPEWVVISHSGGSFQPRDWTQVSCISCISRWTLHHWATWKPSSLCILCQIILSYWEANILERSNNFNICQVTWKSLSRVRLFATPWTIQSMEFSWSEYWSG